MMISLVVLIVPLPEYIPKLDILIVGGVAQPDYYY